MKKIEKIENLKFNLLNLAILRDRITSDQRIGIPVKVNINPHGETRITKRGRQVWMPAIDDDVIFDTIHAARHVVAKFALEGIEGINKLFNGAAIELKKAMDAEGIKFPEAIPGADWIFEGTPWEIENPSSAAVFL